ncbi:MAG: NADH-quinone oxidoreductase subunit J [Phycisphaeraceae bacterium]|nr:NADH-quinone oxidoreductase subunit J [Phycisphaeraceae bacterium]
MQYSLYIASALGAAALYLMMPRAGFSPLRLGVVLGAATLGGLWLVLSRHLPAQLGLPISSMVYYYVFSFIAIAAAARVITHPKPIYSALWFIMVMLASAGLFLVLDAEFMAFAMIIVYGGAILVTYLFVIMLASESGDTEHPDQLPSYDRVAREPTAAVFTGFLLLAVLGSVMMQPVTRNPAAADPADAYIARQLLPDRAAARLEKQLQARSNGTSATLSRLDVEHPENIERVGLDLFRSHPLGLELAGVILLVALVGAVVIARKKVDSESEVASRDGGDAHA